MRKKRNVPMFILLTLCFILVLLFVFLLRSFLKPTIETFNETILIEDCIYGKFKCFKKDDAICKSILTDKSWEKPILDILISHYKQGTNFLDIGSNYGTHSIGIANEIKKTNGLGKVHSFELQPEIYKLFQENIELNELKQIITPHFFGLGDKNETRDFVLPSDYDTHPNPGMLSLLNTETNNNTEKVSVSIKRLDDLHLDNISLIKIDVEGYELEALHGGIDTIERNRPVILIEIWEKNKETYFSWFREHLSFYRIEHISADDYILIP